MDNIDRKICDLLQRDAKRSTSAIAEAVGLPLSTAADRLKRLTASGAIRGTHATLDPAALGAGLCAFVLIDMSHDGEAEATARLIADPRMQELHHVSGPHSYLAKLRVKDIAALQRFLAEIVKPLPAVRRTETLVALDSLKETAAIALEDPPG